MEDVGIFYGHLVHFTVFCYILWTFSNFVVIGYIFPVLVFCTKKNLATMVARGGEQTRGLSISFIFSFSPLYR
jgi:hypothetical protein